MHPFLVRVSELLLDTLVLKVFLLTGPVLFGVARLALDKPEILAIVN